ncbi:DUF1631 family protein [Undibacterium flavidum]|uniref:DUF1631 family protein n=1 Tax=Undibacterium flavidum TaxID=2762297 RepID=A0ABR6YBP4_9BURK|nr:DUF1631 family protein [Undibacterium flavidum]MBC3873989.1 DUF1631 family protein [Undibacterium flavidum]
MSKNQAHRKQVEGNPKVKAPISLEKLDTWQALVQHAYQLTALQIDAFAARLSHALFVKSEEASDAKEAALYFHGAQLLKNSTYTYYYLCSGILEKTLKSEAAVIRSPEKKAPIALSDEGMTLVSYEEMDLKLSISRASRSLELDHAESLAALNMRLASLLDVETINLVQNPFRPEIFLRVLNAAWCEFNPEKSAHDYVLPMLSDLIFDLGPVYQALNELLVVRGVLPDLQESYRMKRKQASAEAERVGEVVKNEVTKKLEQYFSEQSGVPSGGSGGVSGMGGGSGLGGGGGGSSGGAGSAGMAGSGAAMSQAMGGMHFPNSSASFQPANSELFQYLAGVQKNMAIHQLVSGAQQAMRLSNLRQEMPSMFHSGVEKHTFDLMSHVFDGVLSNHEIADPIKELISALQVPVLKAALIDKDFFFQDAHPARRLIDLLSKYSVELDPEKGQNDPLFQEMQRNVIRVQKEFDQQLDLFDEVVTDLENFIKKEEAATIEALQAPINRALQREKFKQASISATNDISMRIGTGEVMAFVETFLEHRWTKVLTLAYSVQDQKPHAVEDAIKTMDDLIWSIKPKMTLAQRQDMINRLPGILARLNKWLSLIKWEDADRVQFFADLAECHASIVRAPLELSPERQMEIAVEAAKIATERRLEKRAKAEAEAKSKAQAEEAEKMRLVAQELEKAKADAEQKALEEAQAQAQAQAKATVATDNAEVVNEADTVPGEEQAQAQNKAKPAAPTPEISQESIVAKIERAIEEAATTVAGLERGVWVQFRKLDNTLQKVRLAWVSPMRSLFIFTSSQKEKSFSVAVDELERNFRDGRATVVSVDHVVDKALLEALNHPKSISEPEAVPA